MGACLSYDHEERKAQARSHQIDKQLEMMAREETGVIKLLLLGEIKSPSNWIIKSAAIYT